MTELRIKRDTETCRREWIFSIQTYTITNPPIPRLQFESYREDNLNVDTGTWELAHWRARSGTPSMGSWRQKITAGEVPYPPDLIAEIEDTLRTQGHTAYMHVVFNSKTTVVHLQPDNSYPYPIGPNFARGWPDSQVWQLRRLLWDDPTLTASEIAKITGSQLSLARRVKDGIDGPYQPLNWFVKAMPKG